MQARITRRDFVNGALVGTGAALLGGQAGAAQARAMRYAPSGSAWTGYGGIGDYAWSNGNTQAMVDAAHGIRDRLYPDPAALPIDEEVDLAIVGGGFSGVSAAYEFHKRAGAGKTALLLDNAPVFGGEAKQNEFEVDGRRLIAPQGSNGSVVPHANYVRGSFGLGYYDTFIDYYREFGLPTKFEQEPVAGGAERYNLPDYHFATMGPTTEATYTTGYHFPGHGWAKNPVTASFANTPWPAAFRKEMDDFVHDRRAVPAGIDVTEAYLDSMTYGELLTKIGYSPEAQRFADPYIAVGNFGLSGNAISAFAAHRMALPGTKLSKPAKPQDRAEIGVVSFPGGNTTFMRIMVKRMIPDAIEGDNSLPAINDGKIHFDRLDRPGMPIRIRQGATAIDVRNEGNPASADHAIVTYVKDGKMRRVRAKAVIMGSGGWVNRNIVTDLSDDHRAAYADFLYGPVMIANVALRNWRFIDKLGFANMRWFDALGWHCCVRRNVTLTGETRPFTPDSPTVLTFYIPFLQPDLPAAAQGPAARAQLFAASYADLEKQIREQLTAGFGATGFDAKRDIAGIILNRWGHAYCAPQPGFYFGRDGKPAPPDVIRRPNGRVVFAHSELVGAMQMAHAVHEAHRAVGQILTMV